jgi:hypothetical protein
MRLIFFRSCFLFGLSWTATPTVWSQSAVPGTVSGTLSDTSGKQSMAGATLALFDMHDSSAAPRYETARAKGVFSIGNIPEGRYRLSVSFQGYDNQSHIFAITKAQPVVNLGTLVMAARSTVLKEVIIERSPISLKKDTVEFDAGSYATKPNAVAEDLLKKLPGVQVDKSGTITAQGEKVQRIMVDGKRFFSDDPKLASKNLPPDVIDKIQVFDDLSDQSKFTGFDDGNRVKTINIVTKKNTRKGYFGKVVAGAGTNEAYDNSVNIHRFNGNQQLSLLGQGNDVNKQNFTINDILGTSGNGGRGGGGGGGRGAGSSGTGSGITTTWAGGLNYRDNWSPGTQAYGSYFFNRQHVRTSTQSTAQNILTPDSSTYTTQQNGTIRRNQNHRINFNLEQQLDSNNSLIFRPNLEFQHTGSNTNQQTQYSGGQKGDFPIYSTNAQSAQLNDGHNGQYDLVFRHKFQKKYRTFSVDMNVQDNLNNGTGTNYSINAHYSPGNYADTLNQQIVTRSTGVTVSPTISYTEPIGKNQIIEVNYNYSYNKNIADRFTYAFDGISKGYNRFDSLYSNAYENTFTSERLSLNYRIQHAKYNFSIGSGVQERSVNSINSTKNITINQQYLNLTPTVNFQYHISKTQNLRFNYSGRTGQPTVSQLQPIITTSDSINFYRGNPALRPQFTHSLRLLYANFNPATQHVMFATITTSLITNDIQSSIVYLPAPASKGSQLTTPVNLNGTFNVNGYFNYGFPLKKPKSNINLITNASYNQSQALVNSISSFSRNTTLGETLSWTTNLKKNFDMNLSSATTYYIARNSLQPTQNLNYYTEVISAEITGYTNSGWLIATEFDYTYSGNRPAGYNASVPLLNPSVAKQIFKNKQGEIRLSVFDLLNQNVSVTRTISTNSIQDTKTNVLTRYAMLTFTYNLRKFAGQAQQMPGMFRGMRGMRPPGGFNGGDGGGFRRGRND